MNQINLELARQFRDEGIKQVADNNQHFVKVARNIAELYARRNGYVTADDVRRNCPLEPLHYNAWGAVFRDKRFQWTGKHRQSSLVQGHGNWQKVWRLA